MITFRTKPLFDQKAIVVLLDEKKTNEKQIQVKDASLRRALADAVKGGFDGRSGCLFPVASQKALVIFAGVGDDSTLTALRVTVRKALSSPFLCRNKKVELLPHTDDADALAAIIEGAEIGTYRWDKYIGKDPKKECIPQKDVHLIAKATPELRGIADTCAGVNLARNLVNDNADLITAEYFEKTVKDLTKSRKEIRLEILGRKEMTQKGLGLHLAVNQGSSKEPRLIIVKYTGDPTNQNYTALLGKGVTFDTGGLNLKPTGFIENMRSDMGGAAAIVGVLRNTLSQNLKKNVIFAMALAENVIDANAYKPGDVIIGYAGKSVEIGNTDAEGRLVLADAIAYLVKNYKPAQVIDVATLTGACIVALGHDYTGLFSSEDALAEKLLQSATCTDDRAWRMPLYPEIKEMVKSKIADIKNIGVNRSAAGSCTAAEFLRQFTNDTPWAHLDIAGTSFADGCGRWYYGYGATGSGVRLLTHFLQHS